MMDNVQKHNICTNVPSSQTFRSYWIGGWVDPRASLDSVE
jgi:ribosome modulation factor